MQVLTVFNRTYISLSQMVYIARYTTTGRIVVSILTLNVHWPMPAHRVDRVWIISHIGVIDALKIFKDVGH